MYLHVLVPYLDTVASRKVRNKGVNYSSGYQYRRVGWEKVLSKPSGEPFTGFQSELRNHKEVCLFLTRGGASCRNVCRTWCQNTLQSVFPRSSHWRTQDQSGIARRAEIWYESEDEYFMVNHRMDIYNNLES